MKYQPYAQYIPSDVEWLGEIPNGWEELRLKFIGDAIIGLTYDPDDITDGQNGTLVLRANNIQDRKLVADDPVYVNVEAPGRLRTKAGDILICSRNGSRHLIGKNAQVSGAFVGCYFGAFNTVFRSPVNDFLFHVFNSSLFEFQSGSYLTSTINQLTLGALNSFVVPLPPAGEQQQIAAFLDWKTKQIDTLVERKQTLLNRLKEKRLAVITLAVTRGVNPSAALRDSGIPWLGKVPKHWDVPPLKFRYNVELGKMLDEKRITGDYPVSYLRNVDVQWDKINYQNLPVMDITEDEYPRYTIKENDVLVCEGGEVGRSAVAGVQKDVIGFQKAIHRLRAEADDELPKFIYYTLLWAVNTGIFSVEGASTIAHLTADQLRRYRFPRPPRSEQAAIVAHLDERVSQIKKMTEKVESVISRLTEYRTALITAATTGKIDVRNVKIPAAA